MAKLIDKRSLENRAPVAHSYAPANADDGVRAQAKARALPLIDAELRRGETLGQCAINVGVSAGSLMRWVEESSALQAAREEGLRVLVARKARERERLIDRVEALLRTGLSVRACAQRIDREIGSVSRLISENPKLQTAKTEGRRLHSTPKPAKALAPQIDASRAPGAIRIARSLEALDAKSGGEADGAKEEEDEALRDIEIKLIDAAKLPELDSPDDWISYSQCASFLGLSGGRLGMLDDY